MASLEATPGQSGPGSLVQAARLELAPRRTGPSDRRVYPFRHACMEPPPRIELGKLTLRGSAAPSTGGVEQEGRARRESGFVARPDTTPIAPLVPAGGLEPPNNRA